MTATRPDLCIRSERADHPQVVPMLGALDAYLATLYAPEDNYLLDVQALLQPDVDFLVAALGSGLVGCGATRRMGAEPDTDGQPYGEIKRMFVEPAVRGQRIAEQVLAALEARLVAAGLKLATLETGRDQHEAIRLYERCGYVRRGPFGGYPDNGLSVFYQKRLPP
jgi:putative acetyltransferase